MESYFERVVARLTAAGFRWYETANFCRQPSLADARPTLAAQPRLLARPGLPRSRDRRGLDNRRATFADDAAAGALPAALHARQGPEREVELGGLGPPLERVLLGLRLDEPLQLAGLAEAVDADAVDRLERLGPGSAQRGRRCARAHGARPFPRRRRDGAELLAQNPLPWPEATSNPSSPSGSGRSCEETSRATSRAVSRWRRARLWSEPG